MVLSSEFQHLRKQSGVYILSPDYSPLLSMNSTVIVKIGKAANLYSRIDHYGLCFRDSFWVYSVLLTENKDESRALEKCIHQELKKKGYQHKGEEYKVRNGSRGHEWFKIQKKDLIKEIRQAIAKYKKERKKKVKIENFHDDVIDSKGNKFTGFII